MRPQDLSGFGPVGTNSKRLKALEPQMYRIWFDDAQSQRRYIDTDKGIWACKDGFWVDDDWQYTVELDACLHWIPPHRIVIMTKLPRSSDNG